MSDEFKDYINPVSSGSPIERLDGQPARQQKCKGTQHIAGQIVSVHRGSKQQSGGHALDVSIGGTEYTEILLRVPNGPYGHLEGKRGVLYVDE